MVTLTESAQGVGGMVRIAGATRAEVAASLAEHIRKWPKDDYGSFWCEPTWVDASREYAAAFWHADKPFAKE